MIAISPKLLQHQDGRLYAYLGINQIAWRFGRQIRIAPVRARLGPLYLLGRVFMEGIDYYRIPEGTQ